MFIYTHINLNYVKYKSIMKINAQKFDLSTNIVLYLHTECV